MAWVNVPAKLAQLDAEEYTDDAEGTAASFKLLASFKAATVDDVPLEMRDEFERQIDYRLGAMVNLRKSKAWPIEILRAI